MQSNKRSYYRTRDEEDDDVDDDPGDWRPEPRPLDNQRRQASRQDVAGKSNHDKSPRNNGGPVYEQNTTFNQVLCVRCYAIL